MTNQHRPSVLIAEDESAVAEGYELWLTDRFDVRVVPDGREALDAVDDTVDVVLLDRMMPELSGVQVLEKIRQRGIDCRVAMVTAVEPDFDVIQMGFDAYITKPPDRQELIDTVERLLNRATASDALQEYHSLMARKGALQTQKSEKELEASDEYQELLERIESKRVTVDENLGDMTSEFDFVSAVREIDNSGADFEEMDTMDEDFPAEDDTE